MFFSKNYESFSKIDFSLAKENAKRMIGKVKTLVQKNGEVNDNVRDEYKKWMVKNSKSLSGGEAAYKYVSSKVEFFAWYLWLPLTNLKLDLIVD